MPTFVSNKGIWHAAKEKVGGISQFTHEIHTLIFVTVCDHGIGAIVRPDPEFRDKRYSEEE